ncbi:MAG: hypothetical protein KDF65_06055 [Anaerolineae bacterium]|nr:hypothetical protein [Anaerolineae bacterium]
MVDCLIYGKIIIDDIRLPAGRIVREALGGGGPQAAFGARLWHDSVGLLTRSGTDIGPAQRQALASLTVDLQGWHQYPDITTARNRLAYDENEYLVNERGEMVGGIVNREDWVRLLAQKLSLPAAYRRARLIHLVTEFYDEPMIETALTLRQQGAVLSLEPIFDIHHWRNRDGLLRLLPQVDVVTPDWPSASGIAGSDDPRQVLAFWSTLGPTLVAIRHGQHGSYIWDRERRQSWHIPPVPVTVIDPTGAGNSYGGGLSVGWLTSREGRVAGCYGAVAAKFLVETAGLPSMSARLRAEARSLLAQSLASVRAW